MLNLPVIVLLFGSMIWGLIWIPLKFFKEMGIEGVPLSLIAYAGLALAGLPILLRQHALWKQRRVAILGIFLLGGWANLAFTVSLVYGDVVRVMVLFYLLPAWGVIGGRLFLGETIDRWRWLAVGLALSGAFIVLGGPAIFNTEPSWVDWLALSSGFTLAMNNILFRATPELPAASKISSMLVGCFFLSALLMLAGLGEMPALDFNNVSLLVLFGFAWILVATASTQWAVTHLEAGRASIIIIMELITAVLSATIIGGESLSQLEMFGGLAILVAAVIEARRESAANTSKPTPFESV